VRFKQFCHAYCCKEISSTCDLVFHSSPLEEDRRTAPAVIVIGLHPEDVRFKLLINEIFLSAPVGIRIGHRNQR
jgi:hypothetical protein